MSKDSQHAEVYKDMMSTGKSLLQLYIELKDGMKNITDSSFDIENKIMNENSIENIEVTDNPDGSANITMDINASAQTQLMRQGLQYLIDEMKMHDEILVLEPNEFTGEAKNWELSDDDRNALFHFGFINALKMGMEKENM